MTGDAISGEATEAATFVMGEEGTDTDDTSIGEVVEGVLTGVFAGVGPGDGDIARAAAAAAETDKRELEEEREGVEEMGEGEVGALRVGGVLRDKEEPERGVLTSVA